MTTEEKIEYCQKVFLKFTLTDVERIAHGVELREWMHAQLAQKLQPDHYRLHWLRDSAKKLNVLLENIAGAFNLQHADDHSTVYDMLDILETAKGEWRRKRDRGVKGT